MATRHTENLQEVVKDVGLGLQQGLETASTEACNAVDEGIEEGESAEVADQAGFRRVLVDVLNQAIPSRLVS